MSAIVPDALPDTLTEQRQFLRHELVEQRQRLAQRLGPAAVNVDGSYPRSMTMRFVTRHPDLAMRILVRVTRLFRKR